MQFDDKKLQRGFVNIEKANQIAVQGTLNTQAALTRRNAISNLNSDFINRNKFTERQIQFRKTELKSISQMESRTGATERAGYMELQETGGTNRPKKGPNLAIPTNRARNNSKTSLVRRAAYQRSLKSKRVKGRFRKGGTRKSRMVAMAYVANRENKVIKTRSGIYSVTRFKKGKNFVTYKKQMIYNTKESSVNIRSTPWLEPATEKPIRDGQAIYNSQINKLLKKDVI
jgi:hypothetical protein